MTLSAGVQSIAEKEQELPAQDAQDLPAQDRQELLAEEHEWISTDQSQESEEQVSNPSGHDVVDLVQEVTVHST